MVKMQMPGRTLYESWNMTPVIGPNEEGEWNTDFYGGDLKGIEETLDYLKKNFGVKLIYLSPIVTSPSNHRYDTSDYLTVDPYAGTNEMLKSLCDAAHKRGIRIMLDGVFNHTGTDSIFFDKFGKYETITGKIGAYRGGQDSEYFSFYKKRYNNQTGRDENTFWWGIPTLVECETDGNLRSRWSN
jgi:glycosidase